MPEAAHPSAELFRRTCGQFATGVAILTTCDAEGLPQGLTINSFTSLSLDPPLVMAALSLTSNLLATFEHAPHFAINILAASQRHLSDRFARRFDDRFHEVAWRLSPRRVPILEGALATLECHRSGMVEVGDHKILIGQVEAAHIHDPSAEPLVFFRGRYAKLA